MSLNADIFFDKSYRVIEMLQDIDTHPAPHLRSVAPPGAN